MLKKHNNTIYKLSLGIKKTIKTILSSTTRIKPIIYMEDFKKAPNIDYIYIEEDTKVEETTIADIIITTYFIRSDITSAINLDTS